MPIRTIKQSLAINYSSLIIHYSLSLIIVLLLVTACSPTKTNSGTLTGAVTLVNDSGVPANDPVDFAGVTIALYNPAVLDTAIVRINGESPHIGILINQETEFDHRLQAPVMTTATGADGTFKLSKIPAGNYNLVLLKDGWGVRYFYDISIVKGQNSLETVINSSKYLNGNGRKAKAAVELYYAKHLSGYINVDAFTFEPNHSYIVDSEASFVHNVIISSSSYIWLNPNVRMRFLSSFEQSHGDEGYCRISSADQMYSTTKYQPSQINRFEAVTTTSSPIGNNLLSSIITSFSNQGWSVLASNVTFQYMIFRYCKVGLQLYQNSNIKVKGCNISNNDDIEIGGISLIDCPQAQITDNIFVGNKVALKQHTSVNTLIRNCYFCNNTVKDIFNLYSTSSSVEHCVFANSATCIETSANSNTNLSYCVVQGRIGILNTVQVSVYGSIISAENCNFKCTDYNIKNQTRYYGTALVHYTCTNNYWYSTIATDIADKIWDHYDEDINDPLYDQYDGVVDFQPYRFSKVPTAGIAAATK